MYATYDDSMVCFGFRGLRANFAIEVSHHDFIKKERRNGRVEGREGRNKMGRAREDGDNKKNNWQRGDDMGAIGRDEKRLHDIKMVGEIREKGDIINYKRDGKLNNTRGNWSAEK